MSEQTIKKIKSRSKSEIKVSKKTGKKTNKQNKTSKQTSMQANQLKSNTTPTPKLMCMVLTCEVIFPM